MTSELTVSTLRRSMAVIDMLRLAVWAAFATALIFCLVAFSNLAFGALIGTAICQAALGEYREVIQAHARGT